MSQIDSARLGWLALRLVTRYDRRRGKRMKKGRQPAAAKRDVAAPPASPYQIREYGDYMVAHQGICHGQPTFKGTRVLVHIVLESLKEPGQTIESVAEDFRLPPEAVAEALDVAANLFRHQLRLPDPWPDIDEPTPVTVLSSVPRQRTARGRGE